MSLGHAKANRWLGLLYWIPVVTLSFYSHFGFPEEYAVQGFWMMVLTAAVALGTSLRVSGLSPRIWYHEIVMCGVDKLSMSITSLSNEDGSRSRWMILFEGYFGLCIKYINPAVFLYMMFESLCLDLSEPYSTDS